jgi:hypothetical protein
LIQENLLRKSPRALFLNGRDYTKKPLTHYHTGTEAAGVPLVG